jgi:hypothetical protein
MANCTEMCRALIIDQRATLTRPTEAGVGVMQSELLWIVYTVALAILNPSKVQLKVFVCQFADLVLHEKLRQALTPKTWLIASRKGSINWVWRTMSCASSSVKCVSVTSKIQL